MRAQNHHFIRLFAPANLRHGVVHIHGLVAERVGPLDLDFNLPVLLHAAQRIERWRLSVTLVLLEVLLAFTGERPGGRGAPGLWGGDASPPMQSTGGVRRD